MSHSPYALLAAELALFTNAARASTIVPHTLTHTLPIFRSYQSLTADNKEEKPAKRRQSLRTPKAGTPAVTTRSRRQSLRTPKQVRLEQRELHGCVLRFRVLQNCLITTSKKLTVANYPVIRM